MIRPTPPNHIRRAGGKRLHQLGEEVISFALFNMVQQSRAW